jgi:hypothetical protein
MFVFVYVFIFWVCFPHMRENMWPLSFWAWLTSLNMVSSNCIHFGNSFLKVVNNWRLKLMSIYSERVYMLIHQVVYAAVWINQIELNSSPWEGLSISFTCRSDSSATIPCSDPRLIAFLGNSVPIPVVRPWTTVFKILPILVHLMPFSLVLIYFFE